MQWAHTTNDVGVVKGNKMFKEEKETLFLA